MRFVFPITIFLLLLPAAATAGSACGSAEDPIDVVQHIFDAADTDQDGLLDPGEYDAAGLERFGIAFEDTDTNADGSTSLEEYIELYQRHHPARDETEA